MWRLKAATVAAFSLVGLVAGSARADRPRVAVMPLEGGGVDAEFRQRATQAVRQGLVDSGVDVAPPPAAAPAATATPVDVAAAAAATMVLRGTVAAEGRSYTFHLEMLDGKTGATIAGRDDGCDICSEAEALETANTAASTLKAQVWTRAAVASVAAPVPVVSGRARVVVAEALDLPPELDEYHGKVRAAIESQIHDAGLALAMPAPGTAAARCTTRDCLTELALSVGATDVLAVGGTRNQTQGFALALELWNAASDAGAKTQGWCNACTGPQMMKAAQDLARPLLAHLAAETAASSPGTLAGADLTKAAPTELRPSTARTAWSWVGIGVGALGIAAGSFFIAEDGAGTCGKSQCPYDYPSRGIGFAIAGAGLVAAGAGLWGLLAPPADTSGATRARLDIGAGSLNLNGVF
jgi:hypothetical protein